MNDQQELGLDDHLLEVGLVLLAFEEHFAAVASGYGSISGQDAVILQRALQSPAQLVRCEAER